MIVKDFLNIYDVTQSSYKVEFKINGDPVTLWDLQNTYMDQKIFQIILEVDNHRLQKNEIELIYEENNYYPVELSIPYHSSYNVIIFNLIIERRYRDA